MPILAAGERPGYGSSEGEAAIEAAVVSTPWDVGVPVMAPVEATLVLVEAVLSLALAWLLYG